LRLLIVSKRRPQQRDLIERPYGRFYHLPVELAALGHEVMALLCSHHRLPSSHTRSGDVDWVCSDLLAMGPRRLYRVLVDQARAFQPDWVIGMSDAQYGWLAWRISLEVGAKLAIDAYDNFESYMPWNSLLHLLWRRSICAADLVTAAGPQLALLLQSHRKKGHGAETIPMVADPDFVPLDKSECRQNLKLPADATLIGYVGSWAKTRGTSMLIQAFRHARHLRPDLTLLVSGRPPKEILDEPGVVGTGYIPDAALPLLINSLDLACVITAETSFGRYSYPAKLCEAMACNVPILATATAPVRWMLGGDEGHLAPPGDAEAFARKMLDILSNPYTSYRPQETWGTQAKKFSYLLSTVKCEN